MRNEDYKCDITRYNVLNTCEQISIFFKIALAALSKSTINGGKNFAHEEKVHIRCILVHLVRSHIFHLTREEKM